VLNQCSHSHIIDSSLNVDDSTYFIPGEHATSGRGVLLSDALSESFPVPAELNGLAPDRLHHDLALVQQALEEFPIPTQPYLIVRLGSRLVNVGL
jgi:hypothetical protein